MRARLIQRLVTRILSVLIPAEVQRLMRRAKLRRQYGLVSLGGRHDYQIAANTTFGIGCRLGGPVYIAASSIGDYTYIETGCRISHATIGRYCSIAPYTLVGLAEHPTERFVSTHPIFYQHAPNYGYDFVPTDVYRGVNSTTVGNDVWIGAGSCIKGGISLGDGAVIGAGAVVTKDVEPYAIYGGVPARLIRYRFDPQTVEFLLKFRWWERGISWLRGHSTELQDIALLRSKHQKF